MAALPRGALELIGAAGPEKCDYIISRLASPGAHPVLFIIHGHQEISRVERLEQLFDGQEALDRFALDHFTVVLPIFRWDSVLLHDHAINVEALWALVQGVLRSLGRQADLSRLYFTGYSMGADALMKLACRYGSNIAAVVPFAGSYDALWYEPEEEMVLQLRYVAIRAYHSEKDTHVSPQNSWTVMRWLGAQCGSDQEWREVTVEDPDLLAKAPPEHEEVSFDVTAFDGGRKEHWSLRGATWHNCWESVYHHESTFGLFQWLLCQQNTQPAWTSAGRRFSATLECGSASSGREVQEEEEAEEEAPSLPGASCMMAGASARRQDSTLFKDLPLGKYRMIHDCTIGEGLRLDTADVGELDPGAEVTVLEVVVNAEDKRVRGRIEAPAGWISLVDLEDGCWWAWPLLHPSWASHQCVVDVPEPQPPPQRLRAPPRATPKKGSCKKREPALICGVSSAGALLVGTKGGGAETAPMASWNAAQRKSGSRHLCIRVGDEIIAVNGQKGAKQMLQELARARPRFQLDLRRAWGFECSDPTSSMARD